jgi:hypothetical protein
MPIDTGRELWYKFDRTVGRYVAAGAPRSRPGGVIGVGMHSITVPAT